MISMADLSDKDLIWKLGEVQSLFERSDIAARTISDGDGPVWILDQVIDRLSELDEASENGDDTACDGGGR